MLEQERQRLVHALCAQGIIKTQEVENAFLSVPREAFIPRALKGSAYLDTPLGIGHGQTISAPHMVAIMCEALDLKEDQRVLEIGTGSGYHAAIVAHIIGKQGTVFSVERHQALADKAIMSLKETGVGNVVVTVGDGSCGLAEYQPYDRIYITCAAPYIPAPLIEQLKDPGALLVPIGDRWCELTLLHKRNGKTSQQKLGGCVFVPLIGKYGQ